MIYTLYHMATKTHMDENGLPWYVDVLAGITDMVTLVALLHVIDWVWTAI
jgi:hypothetical protein